jgi:HEAT repeat protein
LTPPMAVQRKAGIFISYAHKDGADLAQRLQRDLQAEGFDAWLDKQRLAGGASWTTEIECAIDKSHVLLALVTPGCNASEICRAEQLRSLRKGKRVIPLLARSGSDIPLYLEAKQYRDFSGANPYAAQFKLLLDDIRGSASVVLRLEYRVTRTTVPPLPPNFVARPEEMTKMRQLLTGEGPEMRIVGIHGMGGLGKTVLAQEICHDPVIQDAFPDGIIWLGINETNLLEQVREAGRALGDRESAYESLASGSSRLRDLLEQKATLLVLDDVVEAKQLEAFRTGEGSAPRVRILFTTRDRSVGLQWAAKMVSLECLTEGQSVELLKRWAGRDDPALGLVAKRVAYLPLALKIAGAVLSQDVSGMDWLAEVQRVSEMRLDRYSKDPQTNLKVCFDVSLDRLPREDQRLYYTLGVFSKGSRIPFRLVAQLWRSLDVTLTENRCKEVGRAFASRALIEINEDRLSRHDLLDDYAVERLEAAPELFPALADSLVHALKVDDDWVVRNLAAQALGFLKDRSALLGLLQAATNDDDIDVRLAALSALAPLRDPRAIPGLIEVLQDCNHETSIRAANALALIGEPAVLPLLGSLHTMRLVGLCDAIRALEWIGDPRALPALGALCDNEEVIERVGTSEGTIHVNRAAEACERIRQKLQQ